MKTVRDKKKQCSGCTACKSICPVDAIQMIRDEEGFLYPHINEDICIKCNQCYKVCPFTKKEFEEQKYTNQAVYGAKNKDETIRSSSTSGGVFTLLATAVIEKNGIVYGASQNEENQVEHIRITKKEEINYLRKSKYVQSNVSDIFSKIKKDLRKTYVMFVGTPCQVAGLKAFLKRDKNKDNLLLIDIVCHGVPSPIIYEKHKKFLESKYHKEIIQYDFRNKKNGWHNNTQMVKFSDNTIMYNKDVNAFNFLYFSSLISRPSCHNCPYTSIDRVSDVTIADYWGIEKKHPEFDDNKGISLILINSKQGQRLFRLIRENLDYIKTDTKSCLQPQLLAPTEEGKDREEFWTFYSKNNFNKTLKKFTNISKLYIAKKIIKKIKGE